MGFDGSSWITRKRGRGKGVLVSSRFGHNEPCSPEQKGGQGHWARCDDEAVRGMSRPCRETSYVGVAVRAQARQGSSSGCGAPPPSPLPLLLPPFSESGGSAKGNPDWALGIDSGGSGVL